MSQAGIVPDCWQTDVLNSAAQRMLLLCARQAGKSLVAGALALLTAFREPPALVLLISRSGRQSAELFHQAVLPLYYGLGEPVAAKKTALELTFANGSRIVALPGEEGTIRGHSGVSLLILDEAARVPDDLYYAVRPMLAVSRGRLVALSTPFGKRGWFFQAWDGPEPWTRVRRTAQDCPRFTSAFLAEERRTMGECWYRQEYLCSFEDAEGQVFPTEQLQRAFANDLEPLLI